MSRIPGFRSNKTWKKILATFGYLMIAVVIVSAVNGGGSNKTLPTIAPVQTPVQQDTKQEQQKVDENNSASNDITKELTQTPAETSPSVSTPTTKPETNSNTSPAPSVTPAPSVSVDPVVNTQNNQETTVYITRTGKKYHRDGCRSLAKSKSSISLTDAKDGGYTPCSICNPPQ